MRTKYLTFALLAIGLAACTNDENENPVDNRPVAARVTASIHETLTRAQDQTWGNDKIGITGTSTNTNYTNMCYATTGDGKFIHEGGEATGIFFQDLEEVTFSAYYPFTGTEGELPGTEGTIGNISTTDQTQQVSFDFLFAKDAKASKANPTIVFNKDNNNEFTHRMTRLVLNIKPGDDVTFNNITATESKYSLNGIKHSGTFNVTDGTATATSTATDEWTITAAPTDGNDTRTYSMIFFPQSDANLTFKAVINGQTFSCQLTPELKASTSYTYDINVMKTGLQVGTCTIGGWKPVEADGPINAEM
ncbi:fimbrillin family protein [Parabacteroides sp.]